MSERKPNGYWTPDNIIAEVDKVMGENSLNSVPTSGQLYVLNHAGLAAAIASKYPGGYRALKMKFGEDLTRKPHGQWKDESYVLGYVREILKKHKLDFLPSREKLIELGCGELYSPINRYYGGIDKFNEKYFGKPIEKQQLSRGSFKDLQFTINYALRIMAEHRVSSLPSERDLDSWGESGLAGAIMKHHNGFSKFRTHIDNKPKRLPDGQWGDEMFIVDYALKIMHKHNFPELPSWSILLALGYANIINGAKHHGGLAELRKKVNFHMSGKDEKQKLEELLDDLTGDKK